MRTLGCLGVALFGASLGCARARIPWSIELGSGVDSARVVWTEARITTGCGPGADELWQGAGDASGAVIEPAIPRLEAGTYGLSGAAYSSDCTVIAEGCVEVALPSSEPIVVTLLPVSGGASVCPPGWRFDAGPTLRDAGRDVWLASDVPADAPPSPSDAPDSPIDRLDAPLDARPPRDGGPDAGPDPRVVRSLALGWGHHCALMGNGSVVCWGDATLIGRPFLPDCGDSPPSTYDVERGLYAPVEGLSDVVALSTAATHTCALQGSGEVRCWGEGYYYEVLGTAPPPCVDEVCAGSVTWCGFTTCPVCRREPQAVPFPGNVVSIAAGSAEDCAALEDGTVWCHRAGVVSRVDPITRAVEVAAGTDFFCAREVDGSVLCWGHDELGQLGDGIAGGSRTEARGVEYIVEGSGGALSIVAHHRHACAIGVTEELWCWGESTDGQTLDGTAVPTPAMGCSSPRAQALPLRPPPGVMAFELPTVSVAVGGAGLGDFGVGPPACTEGHTCWLSGDGRVRCAGANYYGQCGVGGSPRPNTVPAGAVVDVPAPVRIVAAGGVYSCAVTGDAWDQVWCWGLVNAYFSPVFSSPSPARIALPGTRP